MANPFDIAEKSLKRQQKFRAPADEILNQQPKSFRAPDDEIVTPALNGARASAGYDVLEPEAPAGFDVIEPEAPPIPATVPNVFDTIPAEPRANVFDSIPAGNGADVPKLEDTVPSTGTVRILSAPQPSPFVAGRERLLKPIDLPATPQPVSQPGVLPAEVLSKVARADVSVPAAQPITGPLVQDVPAESKTHQVLSQFAPEKLDEALNKSLWDYLPANMREAMTNDDLRTAMADKTDDKAAKIINGVVGGVGDTAKGFLSPVGIATLGIGNMTRTAQRLVSLAFATQMASSNPQIARDIGTEMGKPEDQRDYGKVARLMTVGGANSFLATIAGVHGLSPRGEALPARTTDNTREFFNQPVSQPEKISVVQSKPAGFDVIESEKPAANPFDVAEQKLDRTTARSFSAPTDEIVPQAKQSAAPQANMPSVGSVEVRTPDGAVDPVQTALNKMRAENAAAPKSGKITPTIADRAAATPDKPVTMADLSDLAAELKSAMTTKEPANAETFQPGAGAPVSSQPEAASRPEQSAAPRKSFFIRPRSDGIHDIIDEVQSQGGIRSPDASDVGGEYDGHAEALQGTASLLRRRNGGLRPDDMVAQVQTSFPRIKSADDLYTAIKSANAQREHLRTNGGGHEAQAERFWSAVSQPENAKGVERINVDQLAVGQKFRIKAPGIAHDELTVTHVDPQTGEVQVKDGPNFGRQDLPQGAEIYIRKGSLVFGDVQHAAGDFTAANFRKANEAAGDIRPGSAMEEKMRAVKRQFDVRAGQLTKPKPAEPPAFDESVQPDAPEDVFAIGQKRGLAAQHVTEAIQGMLGIKELPAGIRVLHDPSKPWGAKIEGRNQITVNAAQISTPERARAVILEEGLHGVWHDHAVQRAWQSIRDLVTPAEMRAEYLKRKEQGLPTDAATIREEAAIARLLKGDETKGVFARLYEVVRNVIKRTFGIDLPATARQQLKEAALEFLRNRDNWQGARGELEKFATGGHRPADDTKRELPERERSAAEVKAKFQQAEADLAKSTARDTKAQTMAEYQQTKALAAARYRTLRDELLHHPEYVAEQLAKQHAAVTEANAMLKPFGKSVHPEEFPNPNELREKLTPEQFKRFQELQREIEQTHMEIQRMPKKMVSRIYGKMQDDGRLPKSPLYGPDIGRSLERITEWLKSQGIDSPKKPLLERLNIADKFAETFHNAKTSLQKTRAKMQALWRASVESYKAPPVDTDFRHVIKSWIYSDQRTGLATHQFVKELVAKVPSADRRKAMSLWLDADGDAGLLRFQAASVPSEYQKPFELAQRLTDSEKQLAFKIKQDFADKLDDGRKLGIIDQGRADYGVPQRWKIKPEALTDGAGKTTQGTPGNPYAMLDSRSPFFSFQREMPSYFDGIMAKGVPENLDIAHLVATYDRAFHKSLSSRGMIAALQEANAKDGLPVVKISGSARQVSTDEGKTFLVDSKTRNKSDVSADGRPYLPVDHSALRGWALRQKDEAGNPIIVKGDMLVHPDHFKYLDNELVNSGLRDTPLLGAVMKTQAFLKASKLSASAFHLMTIGEHMASHLANPFLNGFKIDLRQPDQTLLVRNGLELGMSGPQASFAEGLASHGGLFNKIPYLGEYSGKLTDWMFRDYIPAIMMKTGLKALEANRKRYGDKLTPDQIAELTARQMNAAGGLLNKRLDGADGNFWGQLGANKTILDINRMALLAPQFLEARLKVVGQALKPFGAEQRKMLFMQAAILYVGARVLNQLLDDDPHWHDNPFSVVYKGRAYSMRTIVGDFWHLITDPASFAAGRLAPLTKIGIEDVVLGGRDLRTGGRKDLLIDTHNPISRMAQNIVTDLANWLTPIPVEGLLPGSAGKDQSIAGMMLTSVGIGSRKFTALNQVRNLAAEFNRNSSDPVARNFQTKHDNNTFGHSDYAKLDALLDAGDMEKAKREYQALLADGKKPEQIAVRYDRTAPFTGNSDREQDFIASLTPDQNEIYRKARAEQRARQDAFKALVE